MTIPKNWAIHRLGELCEVKGGKRLPKGADYSDSGYPYIRARDIRNGKITFDDPVYVDASVREKIARYTAAANDVCITIVGINVGDVGIVPDFLNDASLTENAAKLTKLCGITPRYLNYYLQIGGMKEQMRLFSSGAAQDKLGLYKIKLLDVVCPPIATQQKIAAILTAYDDLIENNRQRIALLEKMAEEIYREWFVRLRFPGHEHTPVHKGVPEGWEVQRMRDLVAFYIGGGWGEEQRSTEFTDPACVIRGTDLPNIAVGDVSSVPHRYHKPSNLRSRKLVAGDIVFEVSGGSKDQLLGRTAVMSNELIERFDGKVMCASFCKLIRPNSEVIHPSVLGQFLRLYYSTGLVGTFQVQSTGISNYQFEAFLSAQTLLVPPTDLQDRYSEIAETCTKQIDVLAAQSHKLTETRDLLLNRLISGKLRVDDLDIQFPPSMQQEAA